jgi:hypothetical protein
VSKISKALESKDTNQPVIAPPKAAVPEWIISNGNLNQEQLAALKGKRIMIGTPCYGGNCTGTFANSIIQLSIMLDRFGVTTQRQFLFNESLVQRARNAITAEYMRSGYDYLFFIDADIGFDSAQAIEMILCAIMGKHDVIGASYPLKRIEWPKVRQAILNGVPDQYLSHCAGVHVAHAKKSGATAAAANLPVEVKYLGTGFMLMSRNAFSAIEPVSAKYKNNHMPSIPMGSDMVAYWDCVVHPVDGTYLSEDYLFCKRATDVGLPVMMCPWVFLTHFGNIPFEGCVACSDGNYIHAILPKK